MHSKQPFSRRHGFEPQDKEITIRHEAPHDLREAVVDIAYEAGLQPSDLRALICKQLRRHPDPSNWSEFPNVDDEVHELIASCEWYEVYDIIERISHALSQGSRRHGVDPALSLKTQSFTEEVNRFFRKRGIGWQLIEGEIQIRGPEAFEEPVRAARDTLTATGRTTAAGEISLALRDLSHRPEPDVTGAIQHAVAALECVARDVVGDPKATLGEILKRHPDLLPPPLDQSVEKVWGFSSEWGRHVREGRVPSLGEAELVVGLAASVSTYLAKKAGDSRTRGGEPIPF